MSFEFREKRKWGKKTVYLKSFQSFLLHSNDSKEMINPRRNQIEYVSQS